MKAIIGRIDKADFPLLGLEDIAVKIDTGAFTSSINCSEIVERDGRLHARFLDPEHPAYDGKAFVFFPFDKVTVRSSNGVAQERYRITTNIILFGKAEEISLTLADRQEMKYPVLIGRSFLNKRYLVDTRLTNLSHKRKQQP